MPARAHAAKPESAPVSGANSNHAFVLDATPPLTFGPETEALINQFAAMYPFALDQFQRDAAGCLIEDQSVMVAAPTGTGKTVIAEFGIWDTFRGTGKVFYTTPIKALSNQKYRDLRGIYGDEVGLLTGDVTENRAARVLVMTTEILRNMLLQTPWDLDDVNCIIFDEIHYLADPERGTTWEESLILCPDHIKLICLSATVNNAAEIAAWISRTHRPIRLITHLKRAVPLALHYFVDGEMNLAVDHTGALVRDFPNTGGELRRQTNRGSRRRRAGERAAPQMDEPQPNEIVDALAKNDMLPAIYFLFSRNDCQQFASRLAMLRPDMVSPMQRRLIDQTIDVVLSGLRPEDRDLEQVRLITALGRLGIGFHHAGLLPILKQLVEVLFTRGLMEVVFATDTLALGVNMPARTVVVGRMSKWDGRRRRMLTPNEFQQMAGRAGRRGLDRFGHVVAPYSPWFTFRELLQIATGELHPVRSAFAIRYNTVLNLWDPPRGDRVHSMLLQSLDQFQSNQRIRDIEEEIVDLGARLDDLPSEGLGERIEQLNEYDRLVSSIDATRDLIRRIENDLASGEERLANASPWPEPGRQTVRRVLRSGAPGLVVHARDGGWVVYLGRQDDSGVGSFLFPDGVRILSEYRQLDYLTAHQVELPVALVAPDVDISAQYAALDEPEIAAIWAAVTELDLPDLEAEAREHRQRELERFTTERAALEERLTAARESLQELVASRDQHPCHDPVPRKELRNLVARIDELERERNGLQQRLERELDAEEERVRGVMRGIRNVLHRFGYLHRGFPTEKADMLAEVFDNDGLILCELVDRGTLDHLPPEDLAEVFSWYSFDREFRYNNGFVLSDRLMRVRRQIEDVEHAVLGEERAEGLLISEGHNPNFYGAAKAWCLGQTMAEIGDKLELSEGDLVVTFNKTIDLMRQAREMLHNIRPEHPLEANLRAGERLLKRDIVEQSLTIGFAPIELPPLPENAEIRASSPEANHDANGASATNAPAKRTRKPRASKTATEPNGKAPDLAAATAPAKPKRGRASKTADTVGATQDAVAVTPAVGTEAAPKRSSRKKATPVDDDPLALLDAPAEPKPARQRASRKAASSTAASAPVIAEPAASGAEAKPKRARKPKAAANANEDSSTSTES